MSPEVVQKLLAEAAEWRLIGLLLECPAEAWRGQIVALGSAVSDPDLQAAASSAHAEATEGLYHSTFGPGGPAPAREAASHESVQLGQLLSELAGYYEAFAYAPAAQEPPDHAAVEVGFIGYLKLKEAYAIACGDAERAAITAEAGRRFIEDHLRTIAEPLANSLRHSGVPYLALAADALFRRVGARNRGQPACFPVLAGADDTECALG